jgi:hypothetical protein
MKTILLLFSDETSSSSKEVNVSIGSVSGNSFYNRVMFGLQVFSLIINRFGFGLNANVLAGQLG